METVFVDVVKFTKKRANQNVALACTERLCWEIN